MILGHSLLRKWEPWGKGEHLWKGPPLQGLPTTSWQTWPAVVRQRTPRLKDHLREEVHLVEMVELVELVELELYLVELVGLRLVSPTPRKGRSMWS